MTRQGILPGVQPVKIVDRLEAVSENFAPLGAIIGWTGDYADAGVVPPPSWWWMKGDQLPIGGYPYLYRLIGTRFNTGGETTGYFRLPNAEQVVLLNKWTSKTVGQTGQFTFNSANEAAHTHNTGGHSVDHAHGIWGGAALKFTGGVSANHTHAVSAGSAHLHSITVPALLITYLIKITTN